MYAYMPVHTFVCACICVPPPPLSICMHVCVCVCMCVCVKVCCQSIGHMCRWSTHRRQTRSAACSARHGQSRHHTGSCCLSARPLSSAGMKSCLAAGPLPVSRCLHTGSATCQGTASTHPFHCSLLHWGSLHFASLKCSLSSINNNYHNHVHDNNV